MNCRTLTTSLLVSLAAATAATAQPPISVAPSEIARRMGTPYYSGAILPTPRDVRYGDEDVELVDGPAGRWTYHADLVGAGRARELVSRLLARRIAAYADQFPALKALPSGGGVPVVFAVARGDRSETLPAGGYTLKIGPEGIVCLGVDEAGVTSGLASLLQLFTVREGKLVARCATVRDWPAFHTRYTSEYHLPGQDFFDWMMTYKINGFAACYPAMRWEGLGDAQRESLRAIGRYIEAYRTMKFLVQFHIGGRGGCRPVDCGSDADVARLLATIEETLALSRASHVMICYDDVTPELQPNERGRWQRPAQAHGYVVERVHEAVRARQPDAVVSFCSPYYQGRHHPRWRETNPGLADALAYMADLKAWKNRDVRIVWTGPVTESRSIVQEDIDHYLDLVGRDRKLFYWDNTWHYHQPLRNFHAQYLKGFVEHCADRTSYVNINGTQPIGRFFSVTANDYYWNPDAFDPGHSRRHAVAQFMGPRAVAAAEALYGVRGDDYFVFFERGVDLEVLGKAVADLEGASLDPELPSHCRAVYEGIVKDRAKN
jgi:hypothetical protein